MIHAPLKGKSSPRRPYSNLDQGYQTRAWSPGIIDSEFEHAVDQHYTPFLLSDFKQDTKINFVALKRLSTKVFLSRCFWRKSLDEVGRPGLVSHIVAIPAEVLSYGLSFTETYQAMKEFEAQNETKSGEILPLFIKWDKENQKDPDELGSSLLSRDCVSKILEYVFQPELHVLALLKNTSGEDRIKATLFLAKFLHRTSERSYSLASTIPVDIVLNNFTIVVSERDYNFGNNDKWRKVRVNTLEEASMKVRNDLVRAETLLDEIYRHN